jgi:hypothetical protein
MVDNITKEKLNTVKGKFNKDSSKLAVRKSPVIIGKITYRQKGTGTERQVQQLLRYVILAT